MNYYEHHLGDYLRDTAHLSMLEDGAYRRLIDAYYIRETPLPVEARDVFRLVRAQSKQDREAVETVLREFFHLTDAGWVHHRCDREIGRFREKSEKAKASIRARWEKARAAAPDEQQSNNDRNTNVSGNGIRTYNEGNTPRARPQTPDTRHHPSSKATGGESAQGAPRASRLPPDWTPGPEGLAFAAKEGLRNGHAESEAAKFRDFWVAKAGEGGRKLDWQATWRNWVRRAVADAKPSGQCPAAGDNDEPEWRRVQRERNEAALGPFAARRKPAPETIDMEPPNGAASPLG